LLQLFGFDIGSEHVLSAGSILAEVVSFIINQGAVNQRPGAQLGQCAFKWLERSLGGEFCLLFHPIALACGLLVAASQYLMKQERDSEKRREYHITQIKDSRGSQDWWLHPDIRKIAKGAEISKQTLQDVVQYWNSYCSRFEVARETKTIGSGGGKRKPQQNPQREGGSHMKRVK